MLTTDQKAIISAVTSGSNVLITGPGGVGKSHVIGHIKTVIDDTTITAMTGAAAVLIGGKTLHSTLGIGLANGTSDELAKKVNRKVWNDLKVLVIDEISMLSDKLLDKIEHIARIVRKNDNPFGGIQLVFSGDFLQLPTIKDTFCFKATCWSKLNLETFMLTEIKRQIDPEFQRVLNAARVGDITEEQVEYLKAGGCDAKANEAKGIIPTRILCKNLDVDAINLKELEKLPAEDTCTYEREIVLKNPGIQIKIEAFCPAPSSVTVAIGAQVMLIVNKDQEVGLVNGSRGVVVGYDDDDVPIVKFTDGGQFSIGFHTWEIADGSKVYGHIYAIPLKLAWAVTCHKAQGTSIDSAYINLFGVFEFGQAYVAISRVRSHGSLILQNATQSMFKAHPEALQFYEELEASE